MHHRFACDPALAEEYCEFMGIYEKLGHMERNPFKDRCKPKTWYLPHDVVVSATAMKRKIQVVFDASRLTRGRDCLNEFLLPGPPNWRQYKFAFTADIIKMFRQIWVDPADQDFQRILWSSDSVTPPIEYRFKAVTYGTSCAPFLAMRTLQQLALEGKSRFSLGATCIASNIYVHDIFEGADSLSMAIQKQKELSDLLKSAGIGLDK
jgi:hypothetical protein